MREIKFRGKRLDNGKLACGYLVVDQDKTVYIVNNYGDDSYSWDEVNPETVGQYTGLKDKNGKEIYEGDIFHLGDKNIRYIVVWNDTGFMGKCVGCYGSYVGLKAWQDKINIMGSIYDNQELLEVNK